MTTNGSSLKRSENEILEFFNMSFKDSLSASVVTLCGNKEIYIKCKRGSFIVHRTPNFAEPPSVSRNTKAGKVLLGFDEIWDSNTKATEWVKKLIASL